ncbi:hypothetical protein LZC95_21385 [Pendulispora brunnea]|uniref:Uncharacterized protein n=1 Tax=Pendulispora brunnea TaxID=2905690 RepID=A0ABZ2KL21_9BACT
MRPVDRFSRANGRPLKADPSPGLIRVVGVAAQRELAPPDPNTGLYWIVTALSSDDRVDFQMFRAALRQRNLVAMGVVAGAPPGTGAVLLVPIKEGFALHAIDRSNPTGPFETPFSQRHVRLVIYNWPDRIAPGSNPGSGDGGPPDDEDGRTKLGG